MLELADESGLHLDPWEVKVLEGASWIDEQDRWSALECGLIVPRQNGKGSIIEVRAMGALFLFDDMMVIYTAHQFKTAVEIFNRLRTRIESSKFLMSKVRRFSTGAGELGVIMRSGARMRFIPRNPNSGRGFTADTLFLDEAFNLNTGMITATLPTLSARQNPQVWYATSSPQEVRAETAVIREIRADADSGDSEGLYWAEWSCPKNTDIHDRNWWFRTNPGLGIRVEERVVEVEIKRMTEKAFRVERMGSWIALDRVQQIPQESWEAQAKDDYLFNTGHVCFGIDMPMERGYVSFSIADSTAFELAEQVEVDGAVAWAVQRQQRWSPTCWAFDAKSPAISLVEDFEAQGLRVVIANSTDYGSACSRLYDDITTGRVYHTDQQEMNDAVANAGTRELGDRWAWARKESTVDISPLVSATLAHAACWTVEDDKPKRKSLVAW